MGLSCGGRVQQLPPLAASRRPGSISCSSCRLSPPWQQQLQQEHDNHSPPTIQAHLPTVPAVSAWGNPAMHTTPHQPPNQTTSWPARCWVEAW